MCLVTVTGLVTAIPFLNILNYMIWNISGDSVGDSIGDRVGHSPGDSAGDSCPWHSL